MTEIETNTSKTLADYAYQKIRSDIINGALVAGEKLRLTALCERYDIGMSPLREALARLIGDALVITEGQRGFWVAPLSLEELDDIAHVRCILETEALQLSMEKGDDAWRERLTEAYTHLQETEDKLAGKAYDLVPEWEAANRVFHETLVSCCGSPWLIRLLKTLYNQAERYRRVSVVKAVTERNVREEHEAIYQAVMAGNVLKACKLTEMHMNQTADSLRAVMMDKAKAG